MSINSFDPNPSVSGPTSYSMPASSAPSKTTVPDPTISLADIQLLLNAVEVAVQKGAYVASEMSKIGGIYDKVSHFVAHVTRVNSPQQSPPNVPQQNNNPEPVVPMTAPFAPRGA